MDLNFNNKVFVISGSSKGIGKGIVSVLLDEGAKVVITGRNNNNLIDTYNGFSKTYGNSVEFFIGDLKNEEDVKSLNEKVIKLWGNIHGIVANAASVKPIKPGYKVSSEDWDWYLQNNLKITKTFIDGLVDELIKTKGSVVIIGSIAGLESIDGAPLPYSIAKSSLSMYTKVLSKSIAKYKVRVNLISPGNILFPGGNWDKKLRQDPEAVNNMLLEKVPLSSFGDPHDIALATAFLLSEKAKFITGANLVIDGGQTNSFR